MFAFCRIVVGTVTFQYTKSTRTYCQARVFNRLIRLNRGQRILQWLGLARWKSVISTAMNEDLAAVEDIESSNRRAIALLCFKLSAYERLEAISLLELALWKTKIDECKAAFDTDHERDKESSPPKRPIFLNKSHLDRVDRQSCRINSGAEIVISLVLPFLDKPSLPR
jgi:hypothetical protein